MSEPLVSVIIPIYKVEQYLEQCLDSVINQTYYNLEIILVDDGSPDNCGAICDAYKAKDERIIVIHQENQGLSMARNAGLDICKGEYIAFVDSDDWVESNFIEKMISYAAQDTLVCCGHYTHTKNGVKRCLSKQNFRYISDEAVCAFITCFKSQKFNALNTYPWNKLYPREKFSGFRFPTGLNYEGTYVIIDVLKLVDYVQLIPDCLYNYRVRTGSICRTPTKKNLFDHLEARVHLIESLADNPEFARCLGVSLVDEVVFVYKYKMLGYYELNQAEALKLKLLLDEHRDNVPFFSKTKLKLFLFDYCYLLLKLTFVLKHWQERHKVLE